MVRVAPEPVALKHSAYRVEFQYYQNQKRPLVYLSLLKYRF